MSDSSQSADREVLAEERARWQRAIEDCCALLPRRASGRAVARRLTRTMDGLVARRFAAALEALASPPPVALYAQGGLSRGELSPFSDVDLLLLYRGTPDEVAPVADRLRTDLHDIGLRVGLATRTEAEHEAVIAHEITAATSLLDARLVDTGSWPRHAEPAPDLCRHTRAALRALDPIALVDALRQGMDARHARFGDSVYLLEPNVKMGRGGLRDLQTTGWIASILHDLQHLSALADLPDVVRPEAHRVLEAWDFLLGLRHLLHQHSGWKNDRLTFGEQEALAGRLGFAETHRSLGVERLMGAYYRHAHTLEQRTRRWLDRWTLRAVESGPSLRPVAIDEIGELTLEVRGGRLAAATSRASLALDALAKRRPALLLEIFHAQARGGLQLHPDLAEQIAFAARELPENWHAIPEVAAATFELVAAPSARDDVISETANLGVFYRAFPEFQPVHGWVHHDVYHVYAVDVHSLRTLQLARSLLDGTLPETPTWLSAIASALRRRRLLLMAALLHDVGKGRGGDHSLIGARLVLGIGERIERAGHAAWTRADTATLAWLVEHHLLLSQVSQRRDLSDEMTSAEVAEVVQDLERLDLLTALTVVDMRAVRPDGRDSWKEALLLQLYVHVRARLEQVDSGLHSPQLRLRLVESALRREADGTRLDELLRQLERLPVRLIVGEPVARIVELLPALAELEGEAADERKVRIRVAAGLGPSTIVTVLAPDRAGLLADLAGALSCLGANIGRAHVYTTDDGVAIDVFELTDVIEDAGFAARLERLVIEAAAGRADLSRLVDARTRAGLARRRLPDVRDRVRFDNQASERSTLVEVATRDRPGLLRTIARTLTDSRVDIQVSLISSEGTKAVDVFYVTHAGDKLDDASAAALCEALRTDLAAFQALFDW